MAAQVKQEKNQKVAVVSDDLKQLSNGVVRQAQEA